MCGRTLPTAQFRQRARGSNAREGRCRACYNAYMRTYRGRYRGQAIDRFAAELRQQRSLQRAASLCGAMMLRFGGADRFAALWVSQLQAAAMERPGSAAALRSLAGVARLIELSDAYRRRT